jgi:hypothetical protein
MSKVLLCFEDFSELMTTQTSLQKAGFDVLAITSEFSLSNQVLSFNPDIVVGYGRGPKLSTVGVGKRLKEMSRWPGKVLLIFPTKVKPEPSDVARLRMDMAIEGPIDILKLLYVLAEMAQLHPEELIEKYKKNIQVDSAQTSHGEISIQSADKTDAVYVSGRMDQPPVHPGSEWGEVRVSEEEAEFNKLMGLENNDIQSQLGRVEKQSLERQSRYNQFMHDKPLPESTSNTLKRRDTKKAQNSLRTDWSSNELKNQDEGRKEFTNALFKKKD